MKKIFSFTAMFLLVSSMLFAQVGINANNSSPAPSAMLDVKSTGQGFLPPRMTTIQRELISSPATGLTIYNSTKNCNETYNGSSWVSNTHFIGESYCGGIVFYVYDYGRHGLIASTADQTAGVRWYGGSYTYTGAKGDGVAAGFKNTALIVANQGPVDGMAFAATMCNEYSVTVGDVTYTGWYLPSRYELNLLFYKRALVGGFSIEDYWSSTEYSPDEAWYQLFWYTETTYQFHNSKDGSLYVRAIRAF